MFRSRGLILSDVGIIGMTWDPWFSVEIEIRPRVLNLWCCCFRICSDREIWYYPVMVFPVTMGSEFPWTSWVQTARSEPLMSLLVEFLLMVCDICTLRGRQVLSAISFSFVWVRSAIVSSGCSFCSSDLTLVLVFFFQSYETSLFLY